MTLRYVKITRDGALTDETALDAKVCECCQTVAVAWFTAAGGAPRIFLSGIFLFQRNKQEDAGQENRNWKMPGNLVGGEKL
jgi:hypothetical protein